MLAKFPCHAPLWEKFLKCPCSWKRNWSDLIYLFSFKVVKLYFSKTILLIIHYMVTSSFQWPCERVLPKLPRHASIKKRKKKFEKWISKYWWITISFIHLHQDWKTLESGRLKKTDVIWLFVWMNQWLLLWVLLWDSWADFEWNDEMMKWMNELMILCG